MITTFNEFNNRPVIDHRSLSNPPIKSSPINEIHAMAKYGLNEFKALFEGILFESEGYSDEALLEKTHVCYELDMLSESKSHWFETEGEVVTIDAGEHMILVKNNEAYIISANTYSSINEWWTWDDAKKAWDKLKQKVATFAAEQYKKAKEVAAKAWDTMSAGAKTAWDFVKTCTAAAVKFVGEMTLVEWISLGTSVLSAVVGLLGTAIPGATVIAGILMAMTGGLHLYEGIHKYWHAKEILGKIQNISPFAKNSVLISKAYPEFSIGTVFICLGFYDLSNGLTRALVDPTTGTTSGAIKIAAAKSAKTWAVKAGESMHHLLEGYGQKTAELIGVKLAKPMVKNGVPLLLNALGGITMEKTLGWVWKFIMKSSRSVLSGLDFLLDLPAKITAAITTLQKNATSTLGTIIAKGLATIIKPMTEGATKIINKYIKPIIGTAKKWLDEQIKSYDICVEEFKKYEEESKESKLKGSEEIPETKGQPVITPEDVKVEKSDLEKIKELPPINKEIEKAAAAKGYEVPTTNVEVSTDTSTPNASNESHKVLMFEQFNSKIYKM
jgi:hypothetical protein